MGAMTPASTTARQTTLRMDLCLALVLTQMGCVVVLLHQHQPQLQPLRPRLQQVQPQVSCDVILLLAVNAVMM